MKLYMQGKEELWEGKKAMVIGSRWCSRKAAAKVDLVVSELLAKDYVIVSGMARGVDTLVHQKTLPQSGSTIAVLAHGLDHCYPPENLKLKEQIASEGLLVSLWPREVTPTKEQFRTRTLFMVESCDLVVVVEAGVYSGSMMAANWSLEKNKPLVVVAGSPGTDKLISEGAEWIDFV